MFPIRTLLWLSTISVVTADFVTGKLGDARKNLNNPMGAAYYAALPSSSGIEGSILASTDECKVVNFEVNFANLPSEGGPFRMTPLTSRYLCSRSVILTSLKCITSTNIPFPQMVTAPAPSPTLTPTYAVNHHPAIRRSHRPAKSGTSLESTAPSMTHPLG